MKFGCIHRTLRSQYGKLGLLVGKHYVWFITIPFIFSIVMFTAALKISFLRELDSVFSSKNGRAMSQKQILDSLYPVNTSYNFDASKFSDKGEFGTIIMIAKDGENMLRESLYANAMETERIIKEITIDGFNFSELCAKYGDECQENTIFELLSLKRVREMERGDHFLTYPFFIEPYSKKYIITAYNLGGVEKDYKGYIKVAKAIRLFYFLDNSSSYKKQLAIKWEKKFLEITENLNFDNVTILRVTAKCFENEIAKITLEALPLATVSVVSIFILCFVVCMTSNIVRCKPLIGIFGASSALIGVGTAFGFLIYCGMQYVDLNTAIPFIMLGIGVDDTFVLLAAWRRTDAKKDVPQRMAQTYSEAAVSITITSITNFLSFTIGIFSPFPCFHIFCTYAASSVFFTYLYQITFFGGWMVVSGYREQKNLNPFTFQPIKYTIDKREQGALKKLLFNHIPKEIDFAEWFSRELFGKKIGKILVTTKGKITVGLLYIIYLGAAIWGCAQVRDGLNYEDIYPDNSHAAQYTKVHLHYMTEYIHRIHIIITETLDYSDQITQEKILNVLNDFESSPYISNFTNCWLRSFLELAKMDEFTFSFSSFDMTRKDEFLEALRVFLKLPWGKMFVDDILFNENGTDIVSSRFIVTSYMTSNSTMQEKLLQEVNDIVDRSPIEMAAHELWFPFYEQFTLMAKSSVVSIAIAVVIMTIIFFSFLPHLGYTVCVCFSIVSTQIGIIGYMTLWGVSRNIISVICLLMSVGFSVDYSAHIGYAYINSSEINPKDRLRDALSIAGLAICQGSISTLLGSMFLGLVPSATMRIFFKVVFLVILFATIHSVFLLPLFLATFDNCWTILCNRKDEQHLQQESTQSTVDVDKNEELCIQT